MEEDIQERNKYLEKRLEEIINEYNEKDIAWRTVLIELDRVNERNKKLEKVKDYYIDKIKSLEVKEKLIKNNFIPKSKIKEKIKELEKEKPLYFEKQIIQGRIDLLQELLEDDNNDELTKLCKSCMGCNKLENSNFKGVDKCEYHTVEQIGLEQCKQIIEQIKMEDYK